jgi:SAM-dependent methyltransferase
VTGIDFSHKMIALAQAKSAAEKCRVDFAVDDFLACRFNTKFDYLLFMGVFDYLSKDQAQQFVQKAARLATGKVVASFPKRWTVESVVRSIWLGRQGCPVHFYTRGEIRLLASNGGMSGGFHSCGAIWIAELRNAGASVDGGCGETS